jgi:5-methylcytosine-specific restriction endonuclease McrA
MSKGDKRELERVARKLVYLSNKPFTVGTGLYALAIGEAMKAVGVKSYSGHPRVFIKNHVKELKAYCTANSKKVTQAKLERRTKAPWQQRKSGAIDVKSDDFLSTYEWRRLRMEVLIKHGRRCVCCGATPMTGAVMNVDHIKPRKLFPELALDINNLQVLCGECNHGKGNWDMTDWKNKSN